MSGTLEIRRQIRSIKTTRQITRAMELVAAAKMKKAINNTTALRPFAAEALALLIALAAKESSAETGTGFFSQKSEQNAAPAPQKNLVVFISSDRGLCGGYNTQLFKYLLDAEKKELAENPDQTFDYLVIGKKGQDFLARLKRNI